MIKDEDFQPGLDGVPKLASASGPAATLFALRFVGFIYFFIYIIPPKVTDNRNGTCSLTLIFYVFVRP